MALILDTLKTFIKIKDVSDDNLICKLYHRGTVSLLILTSAIVTANQFIGSPITCQEPRVVKINHDYLEEFCWIHGSYHVPDWVAKEDSPFCARARNTNKGIREDEEVRSKSDTLYYQWVPMVLVINAIIFMIPHQLWKISVKGFLKKLCNEETMKRDVNTGDSDLTSAADRYAHFFHEITNRDLYKYFFKFLVYEILNLLALIVVFVSTDTFLDGSFQNYGSNVLNYYNTKIEERSSNPMCDAFPTIVRCQLKNPSASEGLMSEFDTMCILAQNIINEKIYLFLWFWYMVLFALSGALILFRIFTFAIPSFRNSLLHAHVRNPRRFDDLLQNCGIEKWFVLMQMGQNVDSFFFEKFLFKLKDLEMKSDENDGLLAENLNMTA